MELYHDMDYNVNIVDYISNFISDYISNFIPDYRYLNPNNRYLYPNKLKSMSWGIATDHNESINALTIFPDEIMENIFSNLKCECGCYTINIPLVNKRFYNLTDDGENLCHKYMIKCAGHGYSFEKSFGDAKCSYNISKKEPYQGGKSLLITMMYNSYFKKRKDQGYNMMMNHDTDEIILLEFKNIKFINRKEKLEYYNAIRKNKNNIMNGKRSILNLIQRKNSLSVKNNFASLDVVFKPTNKNKSRNINGHMICTEVKHLYNTHYTCVKSDIKNKNKKHINVVYPKKYYYDFEHFNSKYGFYFTRNKYKYEQNKIKNKQNNKQNKNCKQNKNYKNMNKMYNNRTLRY
jgi:hypothetical protein